MIKKNEKYTFKYNEQYDNEIEKLHAEKPHGWFLLIQKNKNYSYLKDYILNNTRFLDNYDFKFSFVTRIWYVMNRLQDVHMCPSPNCGKPVFRNIETLPNKESRTVGRFCCSHKCSQNSEELRLNIIKRNREKYGCDWITQTEEHKRKTIRKCMEKFGVPYYKQSEHFKKSESYKKSIERLTSDEMKEKRHIGQEKMTKEEKTEMTRLRVLSKKHTYYDIYTHNEGVIMTTSFEEYSKMNTKRDLFDWKCLKCGFEFKSIVDFCWHSSKPYNEQNILKSYARCPECYPKREQFSREELLLKQEVELICKPLGYTVCHQTDTNKKLIHPYEIDIYIPEIKLGIEYNGLFWHSEEHYNKYIDSVTVNEGIYRKSNMCDNIGISLIHVYEDEYIYNPVETLKHLRLIIENKLKFEDNNFPKILDRDKFPIPYMKQCYGVISKSKPLKSVMKFGHRCWTIYKSGTITIVPKSKKDISNNNI